MFDLNPDRFELGQTFWQRRLYLYDRQTRIRHYPSDALIAKFTELAKAIDPSDMAPGEYTFTCGFLSLRFAGAVLQPGTYVEESFLELDPGKFLLVALAAYYADSLNR